MIKLYSYFRSSTAYRVRIALNLKELSYETIPVNLLTSEHLSDEYREVNEMLAVPILITEDNIKITQSNAIIEYLDEAYPDIPLLPDDVTKRAKIREIINIIACDIHPLDNLKVLKYLTNDLNISQDNKNIWYKKWIIDGFNSIDKLLDNNDLEDDLDMIALYLIPQIYNARRFNCEIDNFKNIINIEKKFKNQPAFIDAAPENQIDYNL